MRIVIHPARNRIGAKSQNELGDGMVDFGGTGNGGDSQWLRMHDCAPFFVRNAGTSEWEMTSDVRFCILISCQSRREEIKASRMAVGRRSAPRARATPRHNVGPYICGTGRVRVATELHCHERE